MPTRPPESPRHSEDVPHEHRDVAESFGSRAERYDRSRLRYPDALVEAIIAASPGRDVLDVGCGTGIEARQFRAAGCTVLGVDPDGRMVDVARRSGVEAEVATFEAWDPAGREFDAVVFGQSWHWVDPVVGAAKAGRLLRPRGRLAVFWHALQSPPDVMDAFIAAYHRVAPESPFRFPAKGERDSDPYQEMATKEAEGIRQAGAFSDAEQWRFDWEWFFTREAWLDQLPTFGPMTQLPSEKVAAVLDEVGAAIDAMGGGFTMRSATVAVTAVRDGIT